MPIDREVLVRKSTLIAEDLLHLRPFAALPVGEYLSRLEAQLATERLLERMIGRMLDINYHIAVEQTGVAPRDFYDSFLRLADLQVLPPEFAREIAQAAGLRNRLAHEYNNLDPVQVHGAAGRALRDVPVYLEHLNRFLESAS